MKKKPLHPRNKHINGYDFSLLCEITPELTPYVFINDYQNETIDFSNNNAVLLLGSVDLSGLNFIQFKTNLIAMWALSNSYSIKEANSNE